VVRHVGKKVVELLLEEVLWTSRIVLTIGRVQQAEDGQSVFEKKHQDHDHHGYVDAFVESCSSFVAFLSRWSSILIQRAMKQRREEGVKIVQGSNWKRN
jgi:hypothetical protein